jgi:hypothetical protein
VVTFTRTVTEAGGAVTWDTPIQRNGTFAQPFVDQLRALGTAIGRP